MFVPREQVAFAVRVEGHYAAILMMSLRRGLRMDLTGRELSGQVLDPVTRQALDPQLERIDRALLKLRPRFPLPTPYN